MLDYISIPFFAVGLMFLGVSAIVISLGALNYFIATKRGGSLLILVGAIILAISTFDFLVVSLIPVLFSGALLAKLTVYASVVIRGVRALGVILVGAGLFAMAGEAK